LKLRGKSTISAVSRKDRQILDLTEQQCTVLCQYDVYCCVKYGKDKGKVHPCTGTEALYRSYGP